MASHRATRQTLSILSKKEITATSTLSSPNRELVTIELVKGDKGGKDGKGDFDAVAYAKYQEENCEGLEELACYTKFIEESGKEEEEDDRAAESLVASLFIGIASI